MMKLFLGFSRRTRQLLLVLADLLLLPLALWAAFSLRLGEGIPSQMLDWYWSFLIVPSVFLPVFYWMGLYKTVVRFMGYEALWKVFAASSLYLLIWGGIVLMLADQFFPRSVIIIYWMATLTVVGGARLLARRLILVSINDETRHKSKNIAIFGAGSAGVQLLSASRTDHSIRVQAFIDENSEFNGDEIAGIRVIGSEDIAAWRDRLKLDEVWVALPSVGSGIQARILDLLEPHPFRVKMLPPLNELIDREISVDDVRDVTVEDILGRDAVTPNAELLEYPINHKTVLITGAGGSIGSELVRQILVLAPERLILLDHSEFNLYNIEKELQELSKLLNTKTELVYRLGSVQNYQFLRQVIQNAGVETLFHAAAYKHVPLVESNPFEAVMNNIIGTRNIVRASREFSVERVVLVSTDKAVHPTNVMGATKRVAEMIFQACADQNRKSESINKTVFCMVRFGNVLGSSGSVVPLFRQQIKDGGPVTVTHPQVTRYFMTIPEAVQLVIQAGSIAKGGDLFVLNMGEPVKIVDLATKMIHLSGLDVATKKRSATNEIEIVYSGLRPGEKLYEELLIGEDVSSTDHPKIMRVMEDFLHWEDLNIKLDQLEKVSIAMDQERLTELLEELVSGYVPSDHIALASNS